MLNSVSPFFIVDDLNSTIEFYRSTPVHSAHRAERPQNKDYRPCLGVTG